MRVTGGFLKGRKLFYKKTRSLRPTRDIVREAIFDILRDNVQEADVIEIFAGTGALGFEALSRGARSVVFVDNCLQSIRLLKKNCAMLKMTEKVKIMKMDAEKALKKFYNEGCTFDIIFADPPYSMNKSKMMTIFLLASRILRQGGFFVFETGSKTDISENLIESSLELKKEKKYGSTKIRIYGKKRTSCCLSG
ncbi:MAG: 16S rRNA (guanine(966)-N(2))-methyltransferase RsmD [Candidatus Omnitrophica bacterium]|nr:16S rRNA (guanine(966)-N(2))-methyltransferase RsmD [Candidatus Omnitrophota bacterium]MCM8815965.1 16S rRNA (guanine(966)-N(2))-methyltransferase RsmD [Candidatus Omnitrophota bacterium]